MALSVRTRLTFASGGVRVSTLVSFLLDPRALQLLCFFLLNYAARLTTFTLTLSLSQSLYDPRRMPEPTQADIFAALASQTQASSRRARPSTVPFDSLSTADLVTAPSASEGVY